MQRPSSLSRTGSRSAAISGGPTLVRPKSPTASIVSSARLREHSLPVAARPKSPRAGAPPTGPRSNSGASTSTVPHPTLRVHSPSASSKGSSFSGSLAPLEGRNPYEGRRYRPGYTPVSTSMLRVNMDDITRRAVQHLDPDAMARYESLNHITHPDAPPLPPAGTDGCGDDPRTKGQVAERLVEPVNPERIIRGSSPLRSSVAPSPTLSRQSSFSPSRNASPLREDHAAAVAPTPAELAKAARARLQEALALRAALQTYERYVDLGTAGIGSHPHRRPDSSAMRRALEEREAAARVGIGIGEKKERSALAEGERSLWRVLERVNEQRRENERARVLQIESERRTQCLQQRMECEAAYITSRDSLTLEEHRARLTMVELRDAERQLDTFRREASELQSSEQRCRAPLVAAERDARERMELERQVEGFNLRAQAAVDDVICVSSDDDEHQPEQPQSIGTSAGKQEGSESTVRPPVAVPEPLLRRAEVAEETDDVVTSALNPRQELLEFAASRGDSRQLTRQLTRRVLGSRLSMGSVRAHGANDGRVDAGGAPQPSIDALEFYDALLASARLSATDVDSAATVDRDAVGWASNSSPAPHRWYSAVIVEATAEIAIVQFVAEWMMQLPHPPFLV